jgi:hypothetical protein
VFTLVYRFQPQHGAIIGVVAMVLLAGIASLCVDGLTRRNQVTVNRTVRPSVPKRFASGTAIGKPIPKSGAVPKAAAK